MFFNPIKFLTPAYLFDLRPSLTGWGLRAMLILFVAFCVAGIVIKVVQKIKKIQHIEGKLLHKYFACFTTMGALGLILTGLRYETVYILGSRLWLLIWFVAFVIWLGTIIKFQYKVVPVAKKQFEQKKLFAKYLPKKK